MVQGRSSGDGEWLIHRDKVERLERAVFGSPGHPGMEDTLQELVIVAREREKEHRQNLARLNVIIAILTVLAIYIGLVQTGKVFKSALQPTLVFQSPHDVAQVQLANE